VPPSSLKTKKIRITPKARKLAMKRGISLSEVKGTGPEGAIVERDVMAKIDTLESY